MVRVRSLRIAACLCALSIPTISFAQTESASIGGRVTDTTGAVVSGAGIQLLSIDRGVTSGTVSNSSGIYSFSAVQPGRYSITARHPGFRQVDIVGIVLNVQDHAEENFRLQVGSTTESITVTGETPLLNTQDASVSTVIDRNFAANLPLNGRSFQSLINMTPGVVPVAIAGGGGAQDSGQFSVNGQRAASNYWTVDGVSGNVAAGSTIGGQGFAGATGTTSVLGTTSSLVSVDAMQEFRVQSSSFAPEYGRTPGAQISIVTRSGTNAFHGSLFDYLRNDALDANNWFNTFVSPTLPKAKERQNDFGGTIGGPILKNRTFFFFSYEGLRLRLPQTELTDVPCDQTCTVFGNARTTAVPVMQPYLNAYPLPNGPEVFNPCLPGTPGCPSSRQLSTGGAQFNASFSNPATFNDYSVRVDHTFSEKLAIFGRYNYSPSQVSQRGTGIFSLNTVSTNSVTAQQATVGAMWAPSPRSIDEARFNYSRTSAFGGLTLDEFGGAKPLAALPFPSGISNKTGHFELLQFSLLNGTLSTGPSVNNTQRQLNIVNNFTTQVGSHKLKFGADYRRLTPILRPFQYSQSVFFADVPSFQSGSLAASIVESFAGTTYLFQNIGVFAQDVWSVSSRLNITYGLRWDIEPPPSSISGPALLPIVGFSGLSSDFSNVAYGPPGPLYQTRWANFAPRVGAAYQLVQNPEWNLIVRGGFGVFYDLASSETANLILDVGYPFSGEVETLNAGTFPLSPDAAAPPPITPPTPSNPGLLGGFDPKLKSPHVFEWNIALEQAFGLNQSLSVTYLGSAGRNLLQNVGVASPRPGIDLANISFNGAVSDYEAMQVQFKRRMVKNIQALASYTLSHSIDDGSAGSSAVDSNIPVSASANSNRGPSDFDVRHAVSAALTYSLPGLSSRPVLRYLTTGWSLQSIVQAHSATPVSVQNGNFSNLGNGFDTAVRPDLESGIPTFLYGAQYPGGRAINGTLGATTCADGSASVGPFCPPPLDPVTGFPLRQGNLARNAFRGFGFSQWDLGVHREFTLRENTRLEFRAEMFNVLNHPAFAPPQNDIALPGFGQSQQTLAGYLSGGSLGSGGLSSLYQLGGPRSIQLALHLTF